MHILWMVIFGAIVGAIAKLIMPGRDPGGIIVTIILGILGSVVGGFLLGVVLPGRDANSPAGWIGSILGAILLLWIYRMVTARRTPRP
ncbi:MAG TPA: GlsB/YeaQ/YmgE family stress response membrane protein [Longimicrobiales bacterium]|nr:GlsB/YeaQ/YmgE family stress response membrane protein [Longimicrobiales bacterium]